MPRTQVKAVAEWLARAIITGDSAVESIVHRLAVALGRDWRWLTPLTKRYRARFVEGVRPRHRDVVKFLLEDAGFTRACEKHGDRIVIRHLPLAPQSMQPVSAARNWNIPTLETVQSLADWLHIDPGKLEWFADLKTLAMKTQDERLAHYHYRVLAKPGGSVRLIEAPKARMKHLQRQILAEVLEKVPAHAGAHGFVPGRSTKTFAEPHVGKPVVLRMDLSEFFPSFRYARIEGFFRTLGYPEAVARLLAGICTNAVPRRIWADRKAEFHDVQALYRRRHLPQGAPTSPALANLCSYRVDCRLAGLANAAGATYTRYADDLAFSGHADFTRSGAFQLRVAAILLEEGFVIHHRKTRIMRRSVCQHLAGLVVNQKLNTSRSDFDTLKAILTNCARMGTASQNRDQVSDFRAHLQGRVSYVEMVNPAKGSRLRALLSRVEWV